MPCLTKPIRVANTIELPKPEMFHRAIFILVKARHNEIIAIISRKVPCLLILARQLEQIQDIAAQKIFFVLRYNLRRDKHTVIPVWIEMHGIALLGKHRAGKAGKFSRPFVRFPKNLSCIVLKKTFIFDLLMTIFGTAHVMVSILAVMDEKRCFCLRYADPLAIFIRISPFEQFFIIEFRETVLFRSYSAKIESPIVDIEILSLTAHNIGFHHAHRAAGHDLEDVLDHAAKRAARQDGLADGGEERAFLVARADEDGRHRAAAQLNIAAEPAMFLHISLVVFLPFCIILRTAVDGRADDRRWQRHEVVRCRGFFISHCHLPYLLPHPPPLCAHSDSPHSRPAPSPRSQYSCASPDRSISHALRPAAKSA